MKKLRIIAAAIVIAFAGSITAQAANVGFSDVPKGSWAEGYIYEAVELGVMGGYGNGVFGYGDNMTRAQFAAMLVRLFDWNLDYPDTPTFNDNTDKTAWYYDEIETAVINGAIAADGISFRPMDVITREEMAVMLVRGLGYDTLAKSLTDLVLPFTDVSENTGFIAIAYDFGIINGTSATTFNPKGYATREQAAAMMIRLNNTYASSIDWVHAFYAISSYAQRDIIPELDSLSFGWSSLEMKEGEPYLNTTSDGGNDYSIPDGYGKVVQLAKDSGVADNLNIYMSASNKLILLDEEMRTKAIAQIVSELDREGNYSGVTIDFEEMRGSDLRTGLNLFLEELKGETDRLGLSIYVCVPPVTADGIYYDGYDYKMIGSYVDKVILMAHDYAAGTLPVTLMGAGFTATPPTPIYNIYYALKAITDSKTGVQDKSKIALAVSFGSTEWELQDGKVINSRAYHPAPSSIYSRLSDSTAVMNYSEKYQNPYVTYRGDDESDYIIWYEDERSISAKADLARMFGITGISIWRLGLIPDYSNPSDREIYYDVLDWLLKQAE